MVAEVNVEAGMPRHRAAHTAGDRSTDWMLTAAHPVGTSMRRLADGTRCRGMSGPDHWRVKLPAALAPFQYSILQGGMWSCRFD